jgi:hypothetical protein
VDFSRLIRADSTSDDNVSSRPAAAEEAQVTAQFRDAGPHGDADREADQDPLQADGQVLTQRLALRRMGVLQRSRF